MSDDKDVQPPTREQAYDAAATALGSDHLTRWEVTAVDAVLALFPQPTRRVDPDDEFVPPFEGPYNPQPTSSAEPTSREGYDRYLEEYTSETEVPMSLAEWREAVAEPVSIADMAPGTTLVASLDDSYSDNRPFRYMVVLMHRGKRLVGTDGLIWSLDQFDPSTIRDIASPPTTPEEDDR